MKTCVFCSVVKKNKPYHEIIFEDKKHLVFLDAHPLRKGHVLVIPKKHVDYLFSLREKDYLSLFALARKIALTLKLAFRCKRVAVFVEGFSVPHTHIHLVPLQAELAIGGCTRKVSPKQSADVAKTLRKHLSSRAR